MERGGTSTAVVAATAAASAALGAAAAVLCYERPWQRLCALAGPELAPSSGASSWSRMASELLRLRRLLPSLPLAAPPRPGRRPVRVYMDGCFDLMHFGHANALRQAKACGDVLVVGVIPDSEIVRCKGPPVMRQEERIAAVAAVKWVDEILTDVPYDLNPEFARELFERHGIDYVVHGDDPCLLPDGTDAYEEVKRLGRFKMIKRTEGVSTTDFVGRMLTCVRAPPAEEAGGAPGDDAQSAADLEASFAGEGEGDAAEEGARPALRTRVSRFCPTSRRITQFSNTRTPPPGAKVVYIDGAFDLFHPGHVDTLRRARSAGDFLLVGLHTDADVSARRGPNHPIMNLHERSLGVLACKYVDEVIIGAPWAMTRDMVTTFNISVVVKGSVSEPSSSSGGEDPWRVPREMGILTEVPSARSMNTATIIERIWRNRAQFVKRNEKKAASEEKYYAGKTHVEDVDVAAASA